MRQRTAKASKDGRTVVSSSAKKSNEYSVIKNILITLICFVFLLCFFKWVSTPNVRRSQATKDGTNGMGLVKNILGERESPLGDDFLARTRAGRRQAQRGMKGKQDPGQAPFRKDREKVRKNVRERKNERRQPQNEHREFMRNVREKGMQEQLQHREKTERNMKEKVRTRVEQGQQDIEDVYVQKTKRNKRQERRHERVIERSKGKGTNGRLGPNLLGDNRAGNNGPPSVNNREKGNLIDQKRDNIFNDWVAANYDEKIIESVKSDSGLRNDLKQKFELSAGNDSPPRGDSLRKQAVRQQADAATVGAIRGDSPRKRAILNQD